MILPWKRSNRLGGQHGFVAQKEVQQPGRSPPAGVDEIATVTDVSTFAVNTTPTPQAQYPIGVTRCDVSQTNYLLPEGGIAPSLNSQTRKTR